MSSKRVIHEGVPPKLAFDSAYRNYYSSFKEDTLSLIRSNGTSIFAGKTQANLFLVSMAWAVYHNLDPKELKKRESNIPQSVICSNGGLDNGISNEWLILALGLAKTHELMCLKNEESIYKDAEKYANAGFPELLNSLNKHGLGFTDVLEIILTKIANEFIAEDDKNLKDGTI